MKRIIYLLLPLLFMCGCGQSMDALDRAISMRSALINAAGCSFDAEITADFGDKTYRFLLSCKADQEGNIAFSVMQPQYIEGISGIISAEGGKVIFDDTALVIDFQANELLSPVSAPWVMIKAFRSGYIRDCAQEDNLFRMSVNDSYEEDALRLDIWFNEDYEPIQADIYESNRRILSLVIKNYTLG